MPELVIMRHAKSAWPEGVADDQRPLAARGRRDAPAAGRWLGEHVPGVGLVVCSPAVRARQTCELVVAQLPTPPEVRHDERIYDASAGELLDVLRDLPDEARSVLLIGHNPGLEELVAVCTGGARVLKTSAIAVLGASAAWSSAGPGWARLDELATPRG